MGAVRAIDAATIEDSSVNASIPIGARSATQQIRRCSDSIGFDWRVGREPRS